MYNFLRGHLAEFAPGRVVLDVHGIGFELFVPVSDSQVGRQDTEILLWTHLLLKDDGLQLFGFKERSERDLFRMLLRVTGIGPRLALQVLSGIQPQELVQVMAAEDWKRLTLIPGIGPKTARRLLIELKEKLTDQELIAIPSGGAPMQPVLSQAFAALTNLGFSPEAIRLALKEYTSPEASADLAPADLETIIKKALAKLAP